MQHFRTVLWLALIGLLCVWSSSVNAQDEPPTPTATPDVPEHIFSWSAQVLFPQAVRFTITIDRPRTQINALTLTIVPENRSPEVIDVPLGTSVISPVDAAFTEFAVIWDTPTTGLPMFSAIEYSWQVVTTQDAVATVPGAVEFTDTRTQWIVDEDPDGVLNLVIPAGGLSASAIRNGLRPTYQRLVENTGRDTSLTAILFNNQIPVGCARNNAGEPVIIVNFVEGGEIPCDLNRAQAVYRASDMTVMDYTVSGGLVQVQTLLIDYFFDALYTPIWQESGVPVWFRAGLRQFYSPVSHRNLLPILQTAGRARGLLSLNVMNLEPSVNNAELWQAQSYGMVLFIADEIGVPALFELAREAPDGDSFATAYESAMGQSLELLMVQMQNWLFTGGIEGLFAYSMYADTTPTPEPTRTFTPFPPTPTFTATVTLTPTNTPTRTPTATVTGVLSQTPLPSLTPSDTPVPPTPSNTPRPAGSLVDAPPTAQTSPDTVPPNILLAAGIIVIAALVAVVLLRRAR